MVGKNLPHSSLFAYTLACLLCFYHWVCKLAKPRLDEGTGSWLWLSELTGETQQFRTYLAKMPCKYDHAYN